MQPSTPGAMRQAMTGRGPRSQAPAPRPTNQTYSQRIGASMGGGRGSGGGGSRQMPGLPPSAKVIADYPQGVPTGSIGGGNAGGSRLASALPPPTRQVSARIPAFQAPPPRTPGMSNVARPVTGPSGRERAYNAMVQQAGLTPEQADAAQARGKAALEYRKGGALDGRLDPSQQEYWDQADIKSWAGANKKLADKLKAKHGYVEPASIEGIVRPIVSQLPNFSGTAEQAYASTESNPFLPEVNLGSKFNIPEVQRYPDAYQDTVSNVPAWEPDPVQANRAFSPEEEATSPYGKAGDLLGEHLNRIRKGRQDAPAEPSPQSDEELLRGVNPWNLNWRK